RDSEFHPVKPKIPVLAVSFLGSKADCYRRATILAGGNQHLIVIKGGSRQNLSSVYSDICNTKSQGAALKFLDHFCRPVIGIKCRLCQSVQDSRERSKAFLVFLASGHLLYAYKKALTGSSHEGLSITFHNTIIFGFLLNFIS